MAGIWFITIVCFCYIPVLLFCLCCLTISGAFRRERNIWIFI